MPLKILFADDSMTAQNMGKKILTEAGYEVVAVSNGAAAVKKIAEHKPDIIILDVYMPGYSGLEVCEKVRASIETAKTPVLLTVGKMEPYKPEDANRVKADGVIIKPFEASDLLAIVKKFEERIRQASVPPPLVEQTVLVERHFMESAASAAAEHRDPARSTAQPTVDVPDHMATSAAFSDLLGADPSHAMDHFTMSTPAAFETSVVVPAPPVPVSDYELPVSWRQEDEPVAISAPAEPTAEAAPAPAEPADEAAPVSAEPADEAASMPAEPTAEAVSTPVEIAPEAAPIPAEPAPPHPQYIPVYREPETADSEYEFVPTAVPPTGEIEIPREPALQETAEETTRSTVADAIEPGLIPTVQESAGYSAATATSAEAGTAEVAPLGPEARAASSPDVREAAPEAPVEAPAWRSGNDFGRAPTIDGTAGVTDDDFEARVAAAMAAYNQAPAAEPTQEPVAEIQPVTIAPQHAHFVAAMDIYDQPVESEASSVEAPGAELPQASPEPMPSFEYQPPVNVATAAPAMETAASPAEPAPAAEAAPAAPTADTGADHHTITQAVHRVMERLKPELVEEIMRELKSKK